MSPIKRDGCHPVFFVSPEAEAELRAMDKQQVPPPYVTCGCIQTDTAGDEGNHFVDAAEMVEGRKDDNGKPRMDLIPPEVPYALGRVLEFGAHKYADRNWEKGFAWGRSVAALKRHLAAWEAGQDIDPESGMPHLWHVLTNAAFLATFEARGVGTDDRPKGCALHLWVTDTKPSNMEARVV